MANAFRHDESPAQRRSRGSAAIWITLIVIVAAGLLTLFLIQPRLTAFAPARSSSAQTASTSAPVAQSPDAATPKFDQVAAAKALASLQQRFKSALAHHQDLRPALHQARELVRQYPAFALARLTFAQLLLLDRQEAQAYDQLTQALKQNPADAAAQVLAGTTAMQLKHYQDAEHHYSQAVGLDSNNPKYRLLLASAYIKEGKHEQAQKTLLNALRMDSSLDQAHSLLADLYANANQLNLALDQIDHALDLVQADSQRRNSYLRKQAKLLLRANRAQEALAVMRKLPPAQLVQRGASKELAAIWMRLQTPENAAAHYEQILIVNPAAAWAASEAVFYRLKAGQFDQARQDLASLRRINPRDPKINEYYDALSKARALSESQPAG